MIFTYTIIHQKLSYPLPRNPPKCIITSFTIHNNSNIALELFYSIHCSLVIFFCNKYIISNLFQIVLHSINTIILDIHMLKHMTNRKDCIIKRWRKRVCRYKTQLTRLKLPFMVKLQYTKITFYITCIILYNIIY